MTKTYTQVPGHGLLNEGAAFNEDGVRVQVGVGGTGRGHCTCGERSDILPSGGKRQKWHTGHKNSQTGTEA